MSERGRRLLLFAGLALLLPLLGAAALRLPASGAGGSRYGDLLVGAALDERHVTDVVSAINFDYRAFDTLGEELILFVSVLGVLVLLRRSDDASMREDEAEDEAERPRRHAPPTSDAVRALGLAMVGVTLLLGLYVVTHGQLTPGGGFQGGVLLATAWALLYVAGTAEAYRQLAPKRAIEAVESIGAAAFALVGLGGALAGVGFLGNFLPLGPSATVLSGGTIPLLSLATGLEVAGGFVLAITSFVEEALEERARS